MMVWHKHRSSILAALLIAAIGAVYVYMLSGYLQPINTFWSMDQGVKLFQVLAFIKNKGQSLAISYPGSILDPTREFMPLHGQFLEHNGQTYGMFSDAFAVLTAPFFFIAGYPGLYVIPILASLGALLICWQLARQLMSSGWALAATLVCGLASPLWFYSQIFWEHSLVSFLVLLALWCISPVRNTHKNRYILAGLLLGIATWFRIELVLTIGALILVLILEKRSSSLFQIIHVGLGGLIAGLPLLLYNQLVFGYAPGPHVLVHLIASEHTGAPALAERLNAYLSWANMLLLPGKEPLLVICCICLMVCATLAASPPASHRKNFFRGPDGPRNPRQGSGSTDAVGEPDDGPRSPRQSSDSTDAVGEPDGPHRSRSVSLPSGSDSTDAVGEPDGPRSPRLASLAARLHISYPIRPAAPTPMKMSAIGYRLSLIGYFRVRSARIQPVLAVMIACLFLICAHLIATYRSGQFQTALVITAPVVLLACIPAQHRQKHSRWLQRLLRFAIVFVLLCWVTGLPDGGAQWGPRMLLPAMLILIVVGIARLFEWYSAAETQQSALLLIGAAFLLSYIGFTSELEGLRQLQSFNRANHRLLSSVDQSGERMIVTDTAIVPSLLPQIYYQNRLLFLIQTGTQMDDFISVLQEHDMHSFYYVNGKQEQIWKQSTKAQQLMPQASPQGLPHNLWGQVYRLP